jgi:hypothetical protein
MPTLPRLTLAGMIATLLLAGCAHHPTTPTTSTKSKAVVTSTAASTPSASGGGTHHSHRSVDAKGHVTVENVNLPDHTGIPACDDYLSSYMACHRAAGVYSPSQLPARYQAMRTSLLLDSENPEVRPQLAARCNSLSSTLREALHGKSCAENPPPASSTP